MKRTRQSRKDDEHLLDRVIERAQKDAAEWDERLEAMRGQHTVKEANRRADELGFDGLLEELDAIAYPPVPLIAYHCDPRERWIKSEAEARIERRHDKNKRGQALICIRSLESLQRTKATAQFWALAGIHPDDAENDPDGFSLVMAWIYFMRWKTNATLEKRAAGHKESHGFATWAKAYRFLTATFLACAPRKEDLKRAAESAARCLEGMQEAGAK